MSNCFNLLNIPELAAQADIRDMNYGSFDISPQLHRLATLLDGLNSTQATGEIQQQLQGLVNLLEGRLGQSPPPPIPSNPYHIFPSDERIEETDVRLNRKTTLSLLYRYPKHAIIEYPETSEFPTRPVGHLFPMDPDYWQVPDLNIVYSRGAPMGKNDRNPDGTPLYFDLMVDKYGNKVPCTVAHSTCRGIKVCPFADIDALCKPHTHASLADIQTRLRNDMELRSDYTSLNSQVFFQTEAYLAAIKKLGCNRPLVVQTQPLTAEDVEERQSWDMYWRLAQRGYKRKVTCQGRIVFDNSQGHPIVRCEHYSRSSPNHYHESPGASTGQYDFRYIEAVLNGMEEEVELIENAAADHGYGPRVLYQCPTITNNSTQKANCPRLHRNDEGRLEQPLLTRMECGVKFRIIEPLEEYRQDCPFLLITSLGPHTHPVPLLTHTPPVIRDQVLSLLEQLGDDLADITPRKFLRHPIVKSFLSTKFPRTPHPTVSHLHVSLSNLSHIASYIRYIKNVHFPHGTGWDAIHYAKHLQDLNLPSCEHYIRRVLAWDISTLERHEEDEMDPLCEDPQLKIIVCMLPAASRRLQKSGQFLQSDISFKRIVNFLEFEIACMDRDSNTSFVFCRVFLNRQTAIAHKIIFDLIDEIVVEDTYLHLHWRHLYASDHEQFDNMILQWAADQHRGQAKGLGLHLQARAAVMPLKWDIHEPGRTIQSLGPYEHLRRLYRLCTTHFYRNIKKCAVNNEVKTLMRSLVCMKHSDWEGTLAGIVEKGGKAGRDWVHDKENSYFVWAGICHEKSFIPAQVWQAGESTTNLIETVHRDVNREGVHCTLLGGLQKGQSFDHFKLRSLEMRETYGVRHTFRTGHLTENALKNLQRRDAAHRRRLYSIDEKIEKLNDKLQKTYDAFGKARHRLHAKQESNWNPLWFQDQAWLAQLAPLTDSCQRTEQAYFKTVKDAQEFIETYGKGSGRVALKQLDTTLCDGRPFPL